MMTPVVGSGTLRRLGAFDTGGLPVLSVYLDVDGARSPPADAYQGDLEALIAGIEPRAVGADVCRVREMLRIAELPHGARGLAMFSAAEGRSFAVVPLPCQVRPAAVFAPRPWLEPIADMCAAGARRPARYEGNGNSSRTPTARSVTVADPAAGALAVLTHTVSSKGRTLRSIPAFVGESPAMASSAPRFMIASESVSVPYRNDRQTGRQ